MPFIPSLTSLETVKSQAQANAFLGQRKNSFLTPCGARFHPTSLEARVTGWIVLLQFGYVFERIHLEELSSRSRLSYLPPRTYPGRRTRHGPIQHVAMLEAPRPSCVERPLSAQTI